MMDKILVTKEFLDANENALKVLRTMCRVGGFKLGAKAANRMLKDYKNLKRSK